MKKLFAIITLLGQIVVIQGCASETNVSWENPNLPWEAWRNDKNECLELAKVQAEREYALSRTEQLPTEYSLTRPFTSSMDRFEADRRRDELFGKCMKDRGYRKVYRTESQESQ